MIPSAFSAITLERQSEYRNLLAQCPFISSDYSFVNLWGWAAEYDLAWAWEAGLVWIHQQKPEETYWAPIGPWHAIDWPHVLTPPEQGGAAFVRVPEQLLSLWRQQQGIGLSVQDDRGQWDYLYDVQALVELKGNRFHKKKNLLNQFKNNYPFSYRPFEGALIEKALAMQQDWCTWRDCESVDALAAENKAIARVFDSWDRLVGLSGGAILVEDRMVAYVIAELLPDGTWLIHFEKGNPDYKGVYQAINQMFLAQVGHRASIVNREQDLGDDGLRKAKLSYQPFDFIKKYRVELK
jgi:hypothetical protein